MVTCPRCGFEQPSDRFCAKCGVVMEAYTVKNQTLSDRYGSPLIILGIIAFFTLGLVSYLVFKPKTIDQGDNAADEAPSPAVVSRIAVPESTPLTDIPPAAAKSRSESTAPLSNLRSRAPLVTGDGVATSQEAVQKNSTVKIDFDLVSRDVLEKLTHEGEGPLEIGRYGMAQVPHFKNNETQVQGDAHFKTLASETRRLTLGEPSLVFRGGKEPKSNETIGFFIDIMPTRTQNGVTEYKVSIKRTLPEVTAAGEVRVNSQSFEETINTSRGTALVFAGLLPRKQLVEGEDELYKTNVLRALLDPGFQKGDDEFLIVVNPQMTQP